MGNKVHRHEKAAYEWQGSTWKSVQYHLGGKEMPIYIIMSSHYTPIVMSKI